MCLMKIQVTEYKRKQPFDLFVFSGIVVMTNYVFSKKKKTSRLSKIIICLRRILNILMNNSDENIP